MGKAGQTNESIYVYMRVIKGLVRFEAIDDTY